MTFTPNPPPNYSLLPPENHKNQKNRRNSNHNSHELQKNNWHYRSDATAAGVQSAGSGRAAFLSTLGLSLDCEKSRVAPVISGTRPTRFSTKMISGMARVAPKKHIRSPAADEALYCLFKAGKNDDAINYVLAFEPVLWEEDYAYMLKKLCNTGNFLLTKTCFDFIISKQNGRVAKGKLTGTMIGALGKLGEVNLALRLFETARLEGYGNTVYSFSAMISAYGRNGRFRDAIDLFSSMSSSGLELDMIMYNLLIDARLKGEMNFNEPIDKCKEIEKGIKPNVVNFNSIINVSRQSPSLDHGVNGSLRAIEYPIEESSYVLIDSTFQNMKGGDCILKVFEQLAAENAGHIKKDRRGRQEQHCILWFLQKMHEMHIKPNLVTFSAILNASSRCNSLEDASKMLDSLRLFDSQMYDVTHGLLMGYREEVRVRAKTMFEEMRHMDSSTVSTFYSALTDMLWNFGQRHGAQMVVIEGIRRNVWKGKRSISCLDLHEMSCGAVSVMVHAWLLNMRNTLLEGTELPEMVNILTGSGKRSKIMGDGTLKIAIEAVLNGMRSPFRIGESDLGRFVSPGDLVATWLRKSDIFNLLVLRDDSQAADPSHKYSALGN